MTQQAKIRDYSNAIKRLKSEGVQSGLSEKEFKEIYHESLQELQQNLSLPPHRSSIFTKYKYIIIATILATIIILWNFKSVYSIVVCNLQEYIYPGLRLLRKLSLPFISLFPSLSELYYESCLIQNPFFTIVDMDCWPCSSVNSVREIEDSSPQMQIQNTPFIYKTNQEVIDVNDLQEMYLKNKVIFDQDASKILTDNHFYMAPSDMFNLLLTKSNNDKSLFIWKFNNMELARILRQYIPRPTIVPKFGQSTERFLIIDSSHGTFRIPDTECNYSFLIFLKGKRQVHLQPADECKHHCKTLNVDMSESYLLWYNWWYWRPTIQASSSNNTLIAHVGSYC